MRMGLRGYKQNETIDSLLDNHLISGTITTSCNIRESDLEEKCIDRRFSGVLSSGVPGTETDIRDGARAHAHREQGRKYHDILNSPHV